MERSINLSHHRRGNVLVGCGVVLVVFVVAAIIGVVWIMNSWRGWTASAITTQSRQVLQQSQIDPQEQNEIMTHIEDLMTRFEQGDVTLEQLGKVAEELGDSPLIPAGIAMVANELYIETSTLPDDEKAQARIELDRYAQGIKKKAIDTETLDNVLEVITTTTPDDNDIRINFSFSTDGTSTETALLSSDEVSDEDVRELVSRAKSHADEAGVSDTPDEIDLSDELARAIAKALGEDPTLPETPQTPDTPDPEDQEP